MAQQPIKSKPRGATGPMHPKPPKLQTIMPAVTDSNFLHAIKCVLFTTLFLAITFGLLIWSAS
jgi:hypothetical protein